MPRQAVLFLAETQSAEFLGCHRGNASLGTPHLDRLASQGLLFEKAYTCSPVCGPARSAIFTGLFPHSNGVIGNDLAPYANVPTLGERLAAAGVPAGYVGKWHLDGTDYFGDGRCPRGWDPEVWFDGRNFLDSHEDPAMRDATRRVQDAAGVARLGITADFAFARRVGDRARDFIERHRDQDFFLVVAPDEPHDPFICPEPFVSAFDEMRTPIPNADDSLDSKTLMQREWSRHTTSKAGGLIERGGENAWLRHPRYFGCNSFLDSEIGRVVDCLDEHAPGALVIYTADHGDMFGAHSLFGKGPAMYQEITNVPFLVRWPEHAAGNRRISRPVSHIGITPTILDFFGLPVPDLLEGSSLLEQFRNPDGAAEEPVFMEFNRFEIDHDGFGAFAPIRCVCDGRWKLAINLLDTDELYDLQSDPGEMRNLIGEPPLAAVREQLHERLLEWMDATRDPLRGPHWRRRAWRTKECSSWGGPTRPRPFDPEFFPPTLLYDTGRVIEKRCYDKG